MQAFHRTHCRSATFSRTITRLGDEWPKIDYENMAKVDRAVALALFRVADSSDLPQWNAANPKTEKYVKAHQALKSP